ncbi:caspase family protein [Candidatus Sulfurimonas baltica]|uniref:Caspase family protein n=1 Tax=Candidatus Sulfurimonas baltica TaxID=2740404 RepID=A0A7S7RMS4_9BACT|nr:caspase family protein [Candidatus Sulfurimonas baltica]QOY51703.1 caspase family protein [Candidatus Sulfurimonas baltica]
MLLKLILFLSFFFILTGCSYKTDVVAGFAGEKEIFVGTSEWPYDPIKITLRKENNLQFKCNGVFTKGNDRSGGTINDGKFYLNCINDLNINGDWYSPSGMNNLVADGISNDGRKFHMIAGTQLNVFPSLRSKLNKQVFESENTLTTQVVTIQATTNNTNIITLLQDSKAHKVDNTKWLFIVGIENYEYTDSVIYSKNSAEQIKEVIKKRLGVPEQNIRTLINTNATSAKIDYNLKDMLRRVKSGDTVYFYYSGHGIPVPTQDKAPYMLAQDMNPAYLTDDRFKLQNIYKSLSNSKASKVVAFIDSCFSGGTDNQALIKGVAATRIKPKSVTFDTSKMVVISAGSGTQYSNKYDEKSNRLFSYYVMRGLIENNSNTQRLYDYVKSNVQEKSYEMGASYEQVPVYSGNIGLEL